MCVQYYYTDKKSYLLETKTNFTNISIKVYITNLPAYVKLFIRTQSNNVQSKSPLIVSIWFAQLMGIAIQRSLKDSHVEGLK